MLQRLCRPKRRLVALAAIGAAVIVLVGGSPARGAPPVTERPAAAGAGWLARQMVEGQRFEIDLGGGAVFPDQGLTIDAVFAFAAAGVAGDNAGKAIGWLATADVLAGYVGDGTDEVYAGAHAKLMLAAQVQGEDPTSFGGADLPARLRGLLAPSGRFSDRSAFGDFSNAFSQSLAILALDRTTAGVPAAAVDFLAGSRCPDGGFPLNFGQSICAGDVDSTAMVVQALLAAGDTATAGAGLDWLAGRQQPDGGFGGSGPTSGENANSTGLAAQALRVAGRDTAADKAVAFLTGLQVGCAGPAGDRGAVAYDASGFNPANAPRATAQAVLGLAGVGLAGLDGTDAAAAAPVLGCAGVPSPSVSVSVSPPAGPGAGGGLPITGRPVAALVWSGAGLLGLGVVAVAVARRRGRPGDRAA